MYSCIRCALLNFRGGGPFTYTAGVGQGGDISIAISQSTLQGRQRKHYILFLQMETEAELIRPLPPASYNTETPGLGSTTRPVPVLPRCWVHHSQKMYSEYILLNTSSLCFHNIKALKKSQHYIMATLPKPCREAHVWKSTFCFPTNIHHCS